MSSRSVSLIDEARVGHVPRHHVLGVRLTSYGSCDEAAADVLRVARGRRSGTSVFTCNVDHLMLMRGDADFHDLYRRADVVTIDGAPLVLLCRTTGGRDVERVTGIDLSESLVRRAAAEGLRVALVGGATGHAVDAARVLRERNPDLATVFCDSPRFGFAPGDAEDRRLVGELARFAPHIVIVCLGAPRQEQWIDAHRDDFPGAVLVGAGATIDFVSGHRRRAPSMFRRTGTEAVHRLVTDFPRLWRRYLLRDAPFVAFVPLQAARYRAGRWGLSASASAHPESRCAVDPHGRRVSPTATEVVLRPPPAPASGTRVHARSAR